MVDSNKKTNDIPELDLDTAALLLNNVFAECDVIPNSIPLETLQSWGNYEKTEFRLGRAISYAVLVLLVLLPLMFFKPTIIAQRTNVEETDNAVYEIQIKTLLPVDGVVATLDGTPLKLERVNSKNYMVSVETNGILHIKATSLNGQYAVTSYDVTHIDMEKPNLVKTYTENGNVLLILKDTYSGIDYDNIVGLDAAQNKITPISIDKEKNTVVFNIPTEPLTVSVPDNAGNVLQLVISPAQ